MKLSKIFSVILAACAFMAPAAKATDFYLKDGSVISGFINYQPLKNDTIVTIEATKGYMIVPEKYAKISGRTFVKKSNLSEEWVNWANENNSWDMQGSSCGLYFADIHDSRLNHNFAEAHLIGTGSKVTFMFMNQSPANLTINPKNIVKRVNEPRSPLTLSGETRRYHFDGFDIEGQLIEINSDGTYTVLQDDGIMRSFDKNKILSMEIFAFNPDQPFNEQFDYIDDIITDDNKTHSGIIVYQDFKDGAIRIREEEKPIKLKEIVAFRKRTNHDRHILKDVDIAEGSLMFNDVVTSKWLNVKEIDQNIIIEPVVLPDSLWVRVPMAADHTLNVYAHFRDGENASQWELVKLKQIPYSIDNHINPMILDYFKSEFGENFAKEWAKNKTEVNVYGFTYADIVNKSLTPIESPKSRNGVTKLTFRSINSGKYVLYNKATKKAIILDIK